MLYNETTFIGYEPADLTVHPPPPPELPRVGSFFSYRCLVFPKKCPQMKAWIFRSYSGLKTQKRGFSAYSLKPNFNKLNIIW